MKKITTLFIAVIFASCSQDQLTSETPITDSSLSVRNGNLISYKDDTTFLKEYSFLSEMKDQKQIQNWITKKGHTSLMNVQNDSEVFQDSIIDNTKVIYSNALKAILNEESKFMIDQNVIWLNGNNFYLLDKDNLDKNITELLAIKSNLNVYGSLSSTPSQKNNTTSRTVPNENRSKDWVQYFDSSNKRLVLVLFNETVKFSNGDIASSKMFLYNAEQYKSCSFWRCTWKTNNNTINTLNFSSFSSYIYGWNVLQSNGSFNYSNGSTILIATNYLDTTNYSNSGTINTSVLYGSFGYNWSQYISWY